MAAREKNPKYGHLPLSTSGPMECALVGTMLLNHPSFNKGSAHPADERRDFNLTGLLPQSVQTLEQQADRAYEQYKSRPNDLAKNTFLTSMKEQNEVLYYKVRQICSVAFIFKPRHGSILMRISFFMTIWTRCSASSTPQPKVKLSRTSLVYSDAPRVAS